MSFWSCKHNNTDNLLMFEKRIFFTIGKYNLYFRADMISKKHQLRQAGLVCLSWSLHSIVNLLSWKLFWHLKLLLSWKICNITLCLSMCQVSGLMLASHTGIRHLFSKCLSQYDKLRKRQAFLDNYRNHPTFAVSSCSTVFQILSNYE